MPWICSINTCEKVVSKTKVIKSFIKMLFKLCKRWVETSRFLLLECCTVWSKFFTGVLEIANIHFKQWHLTDTTLKMRRRTCRILEAPCKSSHTSLLCVDFCFRNVHNISVPAHKSAPADRTPGSGVHPARPLVPWLCFERQVIYKVHNAPSCICCINNWYSHIWTKKLIFKRPNACAALLSPDVSHCGWFRTQHKHPWSCRAATGAI